MINFFHLKILSCIFFADEEVIITFLYFKRSYIFAPSSLITFTFLIFLADLLIFFKDSTSDIIKAFESLLDIKNLLNIFVFLTLFFYIS